VYNGVVTKKPEVNKRAVSKHMKRHGLIGYYQRIKPEWKAVLDKVLNELRGKG